MLRLSYWSCTEMLKQRLPRKLSKIVASTTEIKKQAKTEEVEINYKMFANPVFIIQVDLYIEQPSPYKRNRKLFVFHCPLRLTTCFALIAVEI